MDIWIPNDTVASSWGNTCDCTHLCDRHIALHCVFDDGDLEVDVGFILSKKVVITQTHHSLHEHWMDDVIVSIRSFECLVQTYGTFWSRAVIARTPLPNTENGRLSRAANFNTRIITGCVSRLAILG